MLTWSDWRTEPRSNRYHFATRLARNWPVLFVQMDARDEKVTVEESGSLGIQLVHVPPIYDHRQGPLIAAALFDLGYRRPMLWIYNVMFYEFVAACCSPLKVYHATEDYFVEEGLEDSLPIIHELRKVLTQVDLLIAVSPLVREHYLTRGGYDGASLVLSNGCDYAFWATPTCSVRDNISGTDRKVALYQGGINFRLDWDLLSEVMAHLPDWEFWFCGRVDPKVLDRWKRLSSFPNLRYFGQISVDAIRNLAHEATIGIIPFSRSELMYVSMPLKAFEYVACGLPVVSTPIKALEEHRAFFEVAYTPGEFEVAMQHAAKSRWDAAAIDARKNIARRYDYDASIAEFLSWVEKFQANREMGSKGCNILVLYDVHSTHVSTIQEHLRSFSLYSKHSVYYVAATGADTPAADLSLFDVVVIHYCVRVNLNDHLSRANYHALREFPGLKVLFIQDEYNTTETARRAIENLGIHIVFTCVPQCHIEDIYPSTRFPSVEFVPTLTGFVPAGFKPRNRPLRDRSILIGYRGRLLPYWYGDLGQEKFMIGKRMKEICEARQLSADIEWDNAHRIYGESWYQFVESCKAMLGTESGSNVFDDYGDVRKAIEGAVKRNPNVSYEQIRSDLIAPHEGRIRMNQVSPKIFEAILCRTALVLFEGEYSGVIKPWVHFIPLKKDFSNVDDVIEKIHDDAFMCQLTERAYQDVIEPGRYSYRAFVGGFDDLVSSRVRRGGRMRLISGLLAAQFDSGVDPTSVRKVQSKCAPAMNLPLVASVESAVVSVRSPDREVIVSLIIRVWRILPTPIRQGVNPVIQPLIRWVMAWALPHRST